MAQKTEYCSCFPEVWGGVVITPCCKKHDNEVGQTGTYNHIKPHIHFFKCLRKKGISLASTIMIVSGVAFFPWIKQPWLWYKIYRYRKSIKWKK